MSKFNIKNLRNLKVLLNKYLTKQKQTKNKNKTKIKTKIKTKVI